MLKEVGLPVIPFLRTATIPDTKGTPNETKIAFVPDLTYDGSKIYGKEEAWDAINDNYTSSADANELFLEVIFDQKEEILKLVAKYIKLASENDIVLPDDGEGFNLVIDPQGNWELVIIDIELARKRMPELESKEDVFETNINTGEDFLAYLDNISFAILSADFQ